KCRGGNLSIVGAIDDSTAKEILHTLHRAAKTPTPLVTACVGVGVCHHREGPRSSKITELARR
ncbi:hypothetical protein, partial [Microcoleus sp. OTE_8_concoct_300]|uniref:hypothetical protein n=1 Tax=Microcoleus sp. OTE_8_concoct_300 TaxID=2964710 RepID=UPI00403FC0D0